MTEANCENVSIDSMYFFFLTPLDIVVMLAKPIAHSRERGNCFRERTPGPVFRPGIHARIFHCVVDVFRSEPQKRWFSQSDSFATAAPESTFNSVSKLDKHLGKRSDVRCCWKPEFLVQLSLTLYQITLIPAKRVLITDLSSVLLWA